MRKMKKDRRGDRRRRRKKRNKRLSISNDFIYCEFLLLTTIESREEDGMSNDQI